MKQRWYELLIFSLLVGLLAVSVAFAGNGKVSGTVKAADGSPAIGANVVLEGTTLGASADVNGKYFILNVPPGTYDLRASAVGFAAKVLRGVRISSDQILTVDVTLESAAVGLAEVVIEAQRPVVDRSQTSAKTTMSGDDFTSLPVSSVASLVATSASTFKGFVRGGKQFETKTIIEGVDVTDQYFAAAADAGDRAFGGGGGSTPYMTYNGINRQNEGQRAALVGLNLNAVEEASVLTGGVGSDYSTATAGVVSYSLRDARSALTARVDARVSQTGGLKYIGPDLYWDRGAYFAEKARLLASADPVDRAKSWRFSWGPDKYASQNYPDYQAEAAIGGNFGSIGGVNLTVGYFDSHGRLPAEHTRRLNASLKANANLTKDIKISFVELLEDRGALLGWKNTQYMEDFRYYLEGVPKWDGLNLTGTVKMTHMLSPKTFYEIQLSSVNDNSRRGYSDNNNDGYCSFDEQGDFLTFSDTAQVNRYMANQPGSQMEKFFSPSPRNETPSEIAITTAGAANWKIARPGIYYENFTNSSFTAKGDFTSQVSANHQLRGGLQLRMLHFDMTRRAGYIGGVFPSYKNYVEEVWELQPKEYGLYLQDRMEYAGLIINAGLRLDGLTPNAADYATWFAPYTDISDGRGSVRVPNRSNEQKLKWYWSPRLGVSHPISDRAAMYFSFSQQTQSQPYSRLFVNYNDFGNPSLVTVPRVLQDPIKSTNYELGVQYAIFENINLDLNAYYKDILNYGMVDFNIFPRSTLWKSYYLKTSYGYADSRGVELTLRRNLMPVTDWLTMGGRVSYTYSYVKQATSAGGNVTTFTQANDSAKYAGQLPFSDIQYWNMIELNVRGGNTTLTGGYDRAHRINFNVFFKFPWDVMLSGVGTFQSGFYYPLTLADPRSRLVGEGPWDKRVDLRLEKGFTFEGVGRLALYVDVMNVFDWTSIIAYQQGSGADEPQIAWEKYGDPTGGVNYQRSVTQDGSTVYDVPREFYFGLSWQF